MYCMKPPIKEPPEGRCYNYQDINSFHVSAQGTGAVECATSRRYSERSDIHLTNLSLANQFYSLVNGDLCHALLKVY